MRGNSFLYCVNWFSLVNGLLYYYLKNVSTERKICRHRLVTSIYHLFQKVHCTGITSGLIVRTKYTTSPVKSTFYAISSIPKFSDEVKDSFEKQHFCMCLRQVLIRRKQKFLLFIDACVASENLYVTYMVWSCEVSLES